MKPNFFISTNWD